MTPIEKGTIYQSSDCPVAKAIIAKDGDVRNARVQE